MAELSRDHLVVLRRSREQSDIRSEAIHAVYFFLRDGRVVVRKIAPDQFSDKLRFRGRKAFSADFCSQIYILLECFVRPDDRADRRGGGFGFLFNSFFSGHQRGEGVVARRRRAVTAPHIENHGSDATAQRAIIRAHRALKQDVDLTPEVGGKRFPAAEAELIAD